MATIPWGVCQDVTLHMGPSRPPAGGTGVVAQPPGSGPRPPSDDPVTRQKNRKVGRGAPLLLPPPAGGGAKKEGRSGGGAPPLFLLQRVQCGRQQLVQLLLGRTVSNPVAAGAIAVGGALQSAPVGPLERLRELLAGLAKVLGLEEGDGLGEILLQRVLVPPRRHLVRRQP